METKLDKILLVLVLIVTIANTVSIFSNDDKEEKAGNSVTQATIEAANLVSQGDLSVTDDATISGGTLNVTQANTATSTVKVGCIQTYATSTATAVKLTLGKEASTATTTFYGGTSKGTLYWEYGTCPSL